MALPWPYDSKQLQQTTKNSQNDSIPWCTSLCRVTPLTWEQSLSLDLWAWLRFAVPFHMLGAILCQFWLNMSCTLLYLFLGTRLLPWRQVYASPLDDDTHMVQGPPSAQQIGCLAANVKLSSKQQLTTNVCMNPAETEPNFRVTESQAKKVVILTTKS